MSGTTGSPASVRLARDAMDFIESVEADARRRGSEELGLHHWVAAACSRPFLARTIAREADVRAAATLAVDALDEGAAGPPLPMEDIVARARVTAVGRGDSRVHAWHLVLVVLDAIGIATRDTEEGAVTEPESRTSPPPAPVPKRRPARKRKADTATPARPPTPLLDECGTDWVRAAARGELPPMVGREAEMRLLIEGLCRPSKPNVLLVGEAGVGKSALVEGLAARMAGGEVPSVLRDRPLVALSMAQVTRESRYYGVMEQRLSALLVEACAVRAILFLDEGHAMTGSGGREGTGDVASVLKPALARGDLSLISATTEQEYQRFIVPNAALERRFTVVHLAEPGREAVRAMLAAHRDAIAKTCRVGVDDAALDRLLEVTTVRASHRREPDRSRDLLDQAVARAIAVGGSMVTSADIEATAAAVSGAPEVTDASLAALERALVGRGLLSVTDAANVIDRLGTTYAGLVLRPQRPRATVLVLRSGVVDGLAVAETLAGGVFGGPERVIAINVGAIGEPGAISGFLGTPQGFIGHGSHLPIHGLAERPHSVLLLGGVDASHEQLRSLLARAIRDGFLTDAGARRIGLSSAVVVLEATLPRRGGRRLGFRTGDSLAATGQTAPGPGTDHGSFAVAAVGRELAAECDLVVIPCDDAVDGRGWVAQLLGRLATSYRSAGVHLAWEPEVEALLAADLPAVAAREREAAVESRLGRAIRPLLRARPGPWRVRIRHGASGLVAEAEA